MPVTEQLEELEAEFKKEERRETEFRHEVREGFGKVTKGIAHVTTEVKALTDKVALLEQKAPTRAKSANRDLVVRVVRVFVFAWIASFIPLVSGLGAFPDLATTKALAWSALVAAMAAVLKIIQASATKDEAPLLGKGVDL